MGNSSSEFASAKKGLACRSRRQTGKSSDHVQFQEKLQPNCPGRTFEPLERVKGIEPSSQAWEASALPLSYTRAHLERFNAISAVLCQP